MRLVIAGGGTGGHLFPGLAVAESLLQQDCQAQVMFVGSEQGLEARLLPAENWYFEPLKVKGFVGKTPWEQVRSLTRLNGAVLKAVKLLRHFRAHVVLGVGGYVSLPALIAARMLGCPVVLHEQNARAGLANRVAGRWAQRVCLALPQAQADFPSGKGVLTGNPVRTAIARIGSYPPAGPLTLLVIGGSQGARALNDAMLAALPYLQKWRSQVRIIHSAGKQDVARVQQGYAAAGWERRQLFGFIDNMSQMYAQAHIVLCRAGATTVAELVAAGRPAVLVPLPLAQEHQRANAQALVEQGAAQEILQQDLNAEVLAAQLHKLFMDEAGRLRMAQRAQSLYSPGAAELVLWQCRRASKG